MDNSLECVIKQFLKCLGVCGSVADSSGSHDLSTCIFDCLIFPVHELVDVSKPGLGISPSTSILGFFLRPTNLGIRVQFQVLDDFFERERAERLNSENGYIVEALCFSLVLNVVIDLARAKDYFANFVARNQLLGVVFKKWLPSIALIEVLDV